MVPVLEVLKGVSERTTLKWRFDDLGSIEDHRILGAISFEERLILLDTSLGQDRNVCLRFTAGHELGHWVLHRHNHKEIRLGDLSEFVEHKDHEENFGIGESKKLDSARDWLEYQANTFASNLVMPERSVKAALVLMHWKNQTWRNFGIVYVNKTPEGRRDAFRQVKALAECFQVSVRQMKIRLESLGLIRYQRDVLTSGL